MDSKHPSAGGADDGLNSPDFVAFDDRLIEFSVLAQLRDQMAEARSALPETSVWREALDSCETSLDRYLAR